MSKEISEIAALARNHSKNYSPTQPLDGTFQAATRLQQSLLAPLERRCLNWLAPRLPAAVGPDQLTLLGLFSLFAAGICYALSSTFPVLLLLVNFWIAANWFGDSLDGTLARFRNKQRPRYGFYVDHVVDVLGALFILSGLALSGLINPLIAIMLLISFLVFSIEVYLATYTLGTFKLSHWKFSPTEMRLLLAAGNCVAFFKPNVNILGASYRLFDVGCTVAIVVMVLMIITAIARNTRTLYRLERV